MARVWTPEEIEYLRNHVGIMKVDTLAEKLNRPVNGVIIKMKRLGIGNTKEQVGLLTMGGLAELLGIDRRIVKYWTENYGLPYSKKIARHTKYNYFIETTDFWNWAFHNKERIDFAKIERQSIPPEPDWVDPLRVKAHTPKGNYYRPWTYKEERLVTLLKEQGETYKTIAEKINRTPISVEKKYKRLMEQLSKSINELDSMYGKNS